VYEYLQHSMYAWATAPTNSSLLPGGSAEPVMDVVPLQRPTQAAGSLPPEPPFSDPMPDTRHHLADPVKEERDLDKLSALVAAMKSIKGKHFVHHMDEELRIAKASLSHLNNKAKAKATPTDHTSGASSAKASQSFLPDSMAHSAQPASPFGHGAVDAQLEDIQKDLSRLKTEDKDMDVEDSKEEDDLAQLSVLAQSMETLRGRKYLARLKQDLHHAHVQPRPSAAPTSPPHPAMAAVPFPGTTPAPAPPKKAPSVEASAGAQGPVHSSKEGWVLVLLLLVTVAVTLTFATLYCCGCGCPNGRGSAYTRGYAAVPQAEDEHDNWDDELKGMSEGTQDYNPMTKA